MRPIVALIPARSGSKRVKDKNIRLLGGLPLIAHTIGAAIRSGMFTDVVVSTDSNEYAEIAKRYGASVPFLRPVEMSAGDSLDIEWVTHALVELNVTLDISAFSILRPTNPFRSEGTIEKACRNFDSTPNIDSLRAVEPCKQHPGKMWVGRGRLMAPLLPYSNSNTPWHDTPYQSLPRVYAQNASLEIALNSVVFETHTISGYRVMPWFMEGYEGFDINTEEDFRFAEYLLEKGIVKL